jgi:hypothetical protein
MSKLVETSGEEGLQLRAIKEITGTSGDANNRDANNRDANNSVSVGGPKVCCIVGK